VANRISCAAPSFCVALVDRPLLNSFGWAGTQNRVDYWRADQGWSPGPLILSSSAAVDLSCTSATFCAAVDQVGRLSTFNGSGWTDAAPAPSDGNWYRAMSCATQASCTAVTDTWLVHWDGASWGTPVALAAAGSPGDIACPTTSSCITVSRQGSYRWDGVQWSLLTTSLTSQQIRCLSAQFCVALSTNTYGGSTYFWDGTEWSGPQAVPTPLSGPEAPRSVACATTTRCFLLAGGDGNSSGWDYTGVATWDGTSWSPIKNLSDNVHSQGGGDLDCADATTCVLIGDGVGFARSWDGQTWSSPVVMDAGAGIPTSISCTSTAFCMAVDGGGFAVTQTNGAWSAPVVVAPGVHLVRVSCASPSFCLAGSDGGDQYTTDVYTWSGSSWSAVTRLGNNAGLEDVSCPTVGFCAVLDGRGGAYLFKDGSWTSMPTDPSVGLYRLACTSDVSCVATGYNKSTGAGLVLDWDGITWHQGTGQGGLSEIACGTDGSCMVPSEAWINNAWTAMPPVPSGSGLYDQLGCYTATFCLASRYEETYLWDGTQWSTATQASPYPGSWGWISGISCPAQGYCVAIDDSGDALVGTSVAP
jgi:hypothetical protein